MVKPLSPDTIAKVKNVFAIREDKSQHSKEPKNSKCLNVSAYLDKYGIAVVVKKVVAIFYKFYTQYFKRICFMADTIFGIA
jgi:hypothetical protein